MNILQNAARLGALLASGAATVAFSAAQADPVAAEAAAQALPVPVQDNSAVTPLKAGVYEETVSANNGFMKVEVTLSERRIDGIRVVESKETPYIVDAPIARVIQEVLERQSLAVDAVTGATHATQAVLRAAGQAIEKAGGRSIEWAPDPKPVDPAALPERAEEQTDVVIVGAGASGLAAAVAAAEAGARVVVIDKAARPGGALALSAGVLTAARHDADGLLRLWLADQDVKPAGTPRLHGFPDAARIEALVRSSGPTVEWLEKNGVRFQGDASAADGIGAWALAPATPEGWTRPAGAWAAERLAARVKELGGRILPATSAWRLVREGDAVTGVETSDGSSRMRLRAGAVVLASGGFGSSLVRLADATPRWTVFYDRRATPPSATGDGIDLALSAGGVEVPESWIASTTIAPTYSAIADFMYGPQGLAGATLVNETGERFAREDRPGLTDAIARQRDCWLVTDSADKARAEGLIAYFGYSTVVDGKNLLELGRRMGVKAEVFRDGIERYNADVKKGEDTLMHRDPKRLSPIEKAPFLAVRVQPVISGTIGGVVTDAEQRVTTLGGRPVPGLWAAGELANRPFYNRVYEPGTGLLVAFTTGRTAGEAAARAALRK